MTTAPLPEHRLVIGMECHVQLRTRTKAFCPCAVVFGAEPNRHVCPTCLGLPGALPVLNRGALVLAIRAGLALGCDIAPFTRWDRKNYFYADLPKGYQITQFDRPLCTGGAVAIDSPTRGPVAIRIRRAHVEEDTGKLTHGVAGDPDAALLDFNRSGTPLLEIVTHPDLRSADEASLYLEELRRILRCVGASDCDMEKAQFRCEPNVNVEVRQGDAWVPTPIVELKNLNSFAHVRSAIEHERERQVRAFAETGVRGPAPKSTRGWDEAGKRTFLQRAKEEAHDYRYLPEPDLPPVTIAPRLADEIRRTLPELPAARRRRYVATLGLSPADAAALADERPFAEWFEEAVAAACGDADASTASASTASASTPFASTTETAKAVANWTLTDVRRELNARGGDLAAFPVKARDLGAFVRAVASGALPREAAKSDVFPEMAASGRRWDEIAAEKGIAAVEGDALLAACRAALAARPEIVAAWRSGKTVVQGVLVGEVMRRTRGRADAARVGRILEDLLREPD